MFDLLPEALWPSGWVNPPELRRIAECQLLDLDPWTICFGDWLVGLHREIENRYPLHSVVPVAKRGDSDDTACWDVGSNRILIIHIGADPGREVRGEFSDIWAFMSKAFEDFLERSADEADLERSDEGLNPLRAGVRSED